MSSDGDAAGGRRTQQGYVPEGFSALPTGTRLSDRYAIESVIGAGGFGITYLSRHEALGKPYAIKEHFPRQFAFRDGQARRCGRAMRRHFAGRSTVSFRKAGRWRAAVIRPLSV